MLFIFLFFQNINTLKDIKESIETLLREQFIVSMNYFWHLLTCNVCQDNLIVVDDPDQRD